jgi:Domain of unknown function (DUF4177)
MQWEYKIVALGLIVDATEPHQRQKHEEILNDLGREEWEAVAYVSQSDTVLLKRPVKQAADSQPRWFHLVAFSPVTASSDISAIISW